MVPFVSQESVLGSDHRHKNETLYFMEARTHDVNKQPQPTTNSKGTASKEQGTMDTKHGAASSEKRNGTAAKQL